MNEWNEYRFEELISTFGGGMFEVSTKKRMEKCINPHNAVLQNAKFSVLFWLMPCNSDIIYFTSQISRKQQNIDIHCNSFKCRIIWNMWWGSEKYMVTMNFLIDTKIRTSITLSLKYNVISFLVPSHRWLWCSSGP